MFQSRSVKQIQHAHKHCSYLKYTRGIVIILNYFTSNDKDDDKVEG